MTTMLKIASSASVICMFTELQKNAKYFSMFEKMYGEPFDIRAVATPDAFVSKPSRSDILYSLSIDGGWTVYVNHYRRYIGLQLYYENSYCITVTVVSNNGVMTVVGINYIDGIDDIDDNGDYTDITEQLWKDIFATVRTKVSAILRGHKKYVARAAVYDMLEVELDIKTRTPK